jgi:hypothetical protein
MGIACWSTKLNRGRKTNQDHCAGCSLLDVFGPRVAGVGHTASASTISSSSGMVASKIRPQLPDLSRGLPALTGPVASDFNRRAAFTKSPSSELGVAPFARPRVEVVLTADAEAWPSTLPAGTFEADERLLAEGLATVSGLAFGSSGLEASMRSPT